MRYDAAGRSSRSARQAVLVFVIAAEVVETSLVFTTSTGQRTSVDSCPPPTCEYDSLTASNSRDEDARVGTHGGPGSGGRRRSPRGRPRSVATDPLRRAHELPRR